MVPGVAERMGMVSKLGKSPDVWPLDELSVPSVMSLAIGNEGGRQVLVVVEWVEPWWVAAMPVWHICWLRAEYGGALAEAARMLVKGISAPGKGAVGGCTGSDRSGALDSRSIMVLSPCGESPCGQSSSHMKAMAADLLPCS
jgi:hypothetical protein